MPGLSVHLLDTLRDFPISAHKHPPVGVMPRNSPIYAISPHARATNSACTRGVQGMLTGCTTENRMHTRRAPGVHPLYTARKAGTRARGAADGCADKGLLYRIVPHPVGFEPYSRVAGNPGIFDAWQARKPILPHPRGTQRMQALQEAISCQQVFSEGDHLT